MDQLIPHFVVDLSASSDEHSYGQSLSIQLVNLRELEFHLRPWQYRQLTERSERLLRAVATKIENLLFTPAREEALQTAAMELVGEARRQGFDVTVTTKPA